jgi:Carboxypeptidase regulatory-like domain
VKDTWTSLRGGKTSVSPIAGHTLVCPYLERTLLSGQLEAATQKKTADPAKRTAKRSLYVAGVLLSGLLALVTMAPRLVAQSTFGSIRGTVQDASGAVVPGAQVVLHSIDENTDRTVTSDDAGNYVLENVQAGKYRLRASHSGLADSELDGITLAARQDLRLPLTMQVAQQSTTIQVNAAAAEINTENATLGDMKGTEAITQLPLNYRASTTSPVAALASSANVQQDSEGNFAIGGATSNMIGFSVDGISTVNVFNSGVSLAANATGANSYPSSEGISELKVTAFNNNAEFSQVGDVTFTTKSGTNNYHGSLFEYLQNDVLNAKVYNFAEKAPERFNTFGGSLGGPLSVPHLYNGHNKTFFFFDYEGNRRRTSQPEQYAVPTALERTGNLSDLASTIPIDNANPNCPQDAGCLINPATGSLTKGMPFANYTITTPLSQ